MGAISWPTNPFYIISKINRSNFALVGSGGGVVIQPLTSTIEQLWTARPDPRGGAFLQHVSSAKVLTSSGNRHEGLGLAALNDADANQLWRVEALDDGWRAINMLNDWEKKINIYGSNLNGTIGIWSWDGGDNEEWRITEETGTLTVDSVSYDMTRAAADLTRPPQLCAAITVDNKLQEGPITSTYTLQRSVTTSHSITNSETDTTGHKYTQTFGVKGGIDKVIEVSASASFEESDSKTISLTDQKTTSETNTDTVSQQVNVPAGKKYSYQVVVYYGQVTVPYTAHLTFQSSNTNVAPVHTTTSGIFTGVNSTNCEVWITDQTLPAPAVVSRKAI
jgi:hypothetical protein